MSGGVVGVDGGGSRTRAVLVDEVGTVRGAAEAGGSNLQAVGLAGVEAVVDELLRRLGQPDGRPLRSLCLALAGAGRPAEQQAVRALTERRGWADLVRVASDAEAALVGAHAGGPGIVAIAGTGSIVMGRNGHEVLRAGGWGPVLGDEGSGYAIALGALRAVLRHRDGWETVSRLEPELLQALGLDDWDHLVARVYGGDLSRERIAALCPVVFGCARAGDAVATRIVAEAGQALGRQVAAVACRLGLAPTPPVSGGGGVLTRQRQALWPAVEVGALEHGVRPVWREPQLSPVLGALLLAWVQAGSPVTPALVSGWARAGQASGWGAPRPGEGAWPDVSSTICSGSPPV